MKKSETVALQGRQGGSPLSFLDCRTVCQGILVSVSPSAAADSNSGLYFINNSPSGSWIGKMKGNSFHLPFPISPYPTILVSYGRYNELPKA